MQHRVAIRADIPAITDLMARASDALQRPFLTPAQVAASRHFMGLDTQLIADGTYFVIEDAGRIVGCGGWSRRATLFGGDASAVARETRLLDPTRDPARVRAMYTDPDRARRGIGRRMLAVCEDAARAAGFTRVELMATLSGEPLYRACGYVPIEAVMAAADGIEPVPMVRMGKGLR
ncbi:acetyltransferase [Sphingomonas sp. Leaf33]|uniref:GNAT family N-acetyltransferase n=1 Tax=Sphingomonas sp. Leaf33 TaxID=1736215 RepID=UPI0006F812E2|nr:GNAT family N-acetyltransferase [Sphingomonas sp. Leaf33]KQN19258.1 acetyltransferase [Sphingomonas sp. Leaf33]